jgi:RimJ/RimL family protein N-acetyltransferase
VGRAGFHGPPDAAGTVEVGYAIDPAHRRQGCARAALVTLLRRAAREPVLHVVRATISPGSTASRNLVLQHGSTEVGEQWDDRGRAAGRLRGRGRARDTRRLTVDVLYSVAMHTTGTIIIA